MTDAPHPPSIEAFRTVLDDGSEDAVVSQLEQYERAGPDDRKAALRELRERAAAGTDVPTPIVSALEPFLTDEERSVRLTTAKLFATLAASRPETVVDRTDSLAERLADEGEFYYVRARAAEALGYVARERPDAVATPELLADLRVGLEFDEPEVREKLAKALEGIALGDPDRLRHHVSELAAHLDTDDELVRYHLCTALVAVGCAFPGALTDGVDEICNRLDDECAFVRGRAAEAIGVLARSSGDPRAFPETELSDLIEDETPFAAERARFALASIESNSAADATESIGSVEVIRERTDEIAEEIATPDGTECPRCGLTIPDTESSVCPHCGVPY